MTGNACPRLLSMFRANNQTQPISLPGDAQRLKDPAEKNFKGFFSAVCFTTRTATSVAQCKPNQTKPTKMKTIPTLLIAIAAIALGSTASYAGPSDSVAFSLAAAKENSERSTSDASAQSTAQPKTIAFSHKGKTAAAPKRVVMHRPGGSPTKP